MIHNSDVIIINKNGMGSADPELALKLVKTYLNMLDLGEKLPACICFYTEGVKLTVEGSPVLEELESLAAKGVRLIVCTTCLNYYNLFEQLAVGRAGSMKDIVEAQWGAGRVITL